MALTLEFVTLAYAGVQAIAKKKLDSRLLGNDEILTLPGVSGLSKCHSD